jgi:hypothetical protein
LGLNFANDQQRNQAVKGLTEEAIERAVAERRAGVAVSGTHGALVQELTTSLCGPSGPRASAPAELALMLCGYCLAEGRVLRLLPPSDDLQRTNRLAGDRTVSEHISRVLGRFNVPATDGAMQSSTYRAGYQAAQAADPAVRDLLQWLSAGPGLDEVEVLFRHLARAFAELELAFAELPVLTADAFSFVAMKRLVERLLAHPSQGAYEQYLVAALLHEEFALVHPSWRVETKAVGAADLSSQTPGDVQVRQRQALVQAIEVSANDWQGKLRQAAQTGRRTSTRQVTVVAPAGGLTADELAGAISSARLPAGVGVDVAVVDLPSFVDAVSARLTPQSRAAAVRLVHRHLVTWGRTRPDLVSYLVVAVADLGLMAAGPGVAPSPTIAEPLTRLRGLSAQAADDVVVEVDRGDLEAVLVWVGDRLEAE